MNEIETNADREMFTKRPDYSNLSFALLVQQGCILATMSTWAGETVSETRKANKKSPTTIKTTETTKGRRRRSAAVMITCENVEQQQQQRPDGYFNSHVDDGDREAVADRVVVATEQRRVFEDESGTRSLVRARHPEEKKKTMDDLEAENHGIVDGTHVVGSTEHLE
jgi:hypothetical protein